MKRSEVLVKLQRYYGFKHVMVEENYITPNEFMDKVLELVEELGMVPPILEDQSWKMAGNGEMTYAVQEWETE
jgi:hypothetical protein